MMTVSYQPKRDNSYVNNLYVVQTADRLSPHAPSASLLLQNLVDLSIHMYKSASTST